MKTKLQILVTVLSIVFSMANASAQQTTESGGGGGGATTSASQTYIDPQTHLPEATPVARVYFNPQTGLPESMPDIDPTTGLPADGSPPFKDSNGSPTWVSSSWRDPYNALPSVNFLSLPLTEVARQLQEQFKDYFDIIFPTASSGFDPTQIDVQLQLKNVKASEIFRAMNLQFELDKRPLRWELTLNGSRPTAILRNLPQLEPPSPPQIRKVFFVGDMLNEYPGANDVDKLGDVSGKINDAWDQTGTTRGRVHIYPAGQLLIVSGTPDQVDLAEQILKALKEKADYEHSHPRQQPGNSE